MKVESTVQPESIWVKEIRENDMATVRLRKNIAQKTNEENDTIYEYDEVEINIINRDGLEDYIDAHFDIMFSTGMAKENATNPPSDQDRIFALESAVTALMGV